MRAEIIVDEEFERMFQPAEVAIAQGAGFRVRVAKVEPAESGGAFPGPYGIGPM